MNLRKVRAFLNPFNSSGGWLGRAFMPLAGFLVTASMFLAAPFSPVDIAGFVTHGLDVSVYSGEIDKGRWQQAGVDVAVVGAWHGGSANPYAEATLRNARAAGKIMATYCYLRHDRDIAWQIDQCKAATGSEWRYLNFVAVDAEDRGLTVGQIIVGLRRVEALGGRAVLYSGCWFINGYLLRAEVPQLAPWPYWNASYDGDPDVDYPGCIPGAKLMGEQYAGSGMWGAGLNIWSDKNVFDDVFIREGYPFVGGPATSSKCPAFVPWPGYGIFMGRWYQGDINGDGLRDLIHVVNDDYIHPWLNLGNCQYEVGYWGKAK